MPKPGRSPRIISRQLAFGFGTVSIGSVAMCVMLLGIINDVAGLVSGMRHDESSIRKGFELATAVREQSTHIAHSCSKPTPLTWRTMNGWRRQEALRIEQLAWACSAELSASCSSWHSRSASRCGCGVPF